MELNNFNKIMQEAQDVINHIDDVKAREILKEIASAISDSQNQINQDLRIKLEDLKTKLEIVAFPNLPDEVAENVLRNHYLEAVNIGIDMENRLTAKLFFVPEIPRDELRKKLQKAILENNEQFGPLTVGQWLREFEKMFNIHTRDRSAPVRFVMEHPQARALSEADKAKLKEIVYTYDYLLVSTLPATGPVLEEILSSAVAETRAIREPAEAKPIIAPVRTGEARTGQPFYEPLMQRGTARPVGGQGEKTIGIVNLSLSQALQKYPRLGEQVVTGNPIKLKIFPDPVRPSVKNWIAEYHSVLDAGSHGTMERGNFLYHSENGKRLTAGERQKLAVILKSLDENESISVDAERQEIIFQAAGNSQQATADKISKSQFPISNRIPNPKIQNYFSNKANSTNQTNEADFRFSSPQRLQSEKTQPRNYPHYNSNRAEAVDYREDKPKPEPLKPPLPPKPEPRIEGNLVDLRNQQ